MVFSSTIFLFCFLPLFLAVYYLTPLRWRSPVILVFSYLFYGWWKLEFLGLLVGVTAVSYVIGKYLSASADPARRRLLLSVGIVLNLAALVYFKYANFGMQALNDLLGMLHLSAIPFANVILPIGLSFYIFHAISYLVDLYRKDAEPSRNFVDFASFIALFPHLVAGPVLRFRLLADQFRSRTHSLQLFGQGCLLFMGGFCAKVLVADPIAPVADAAFALNAPSVADAWLGTVAYTLQLFFDFSGYSTMAIGLALMIGFRFPQNFNDPYWSRSITEFWQRWHMSLSGWIRDYVYIPLGGNRKGPIRTYINLGLAMLICGLWHGANWTFIVWGAWHGGVLLIERFLSHRFGPSRFPVAIKWAWTLFLVMLGWVVFRAESMHAAGRMFRGMFGGNGFGLTAPMAWHVSTDRLLMMGVGVVLVLALPWLKTDKARWTKALLIPLFVVAVATLASQKFTPFLYFQF